MDIEKPMWQRCIALEVTHNLCSNPKLVRYVIIIRAREVFEFKFQIMVGQQAFLIVTSQCSQINFLENYYVIIRAC